MCAGPSCSVHTHHHPISPRIPAGTSPVVASGTGFTGGLSSSISPISTPGSLNTSFYGDLAVQHRPG